MLSPLKGATHLHNQTILNIGNFCANTLTTTKGCQSVRTICGMFTLWRVVESIRCSIISYPDCVGRFMLASFHKQLTIWILSDCR